MPILSHVIGQRSSECFGSSEFSARWRHWFNMFVALYTATKTTTRLTSIKQYNWSYQSVCCTVANNVLFSAYSSPEGYIVLGIWAQNNTSIIIGYHGIRFTKLINWPDFLFQLNYHRYKVFVKCLTSLSYCPKIHRRIVLQSSLFQSWCKSLTASEKNSSMSCCGTSRNNCNNSLCTCLNTLDSLYKE